MSLHRGDLVTVAAKGPYTGKPRPALVVQADRLSQLASVMVYPLTGDLIAAAPLRVRIDPGRLNNLRQSSDVMVDKLSAVPRDAVSEAFGRVSAAELSNVDVGLRLLLEI
ncbi:MAG: type II toxin-antitoxin system PemK/MazF family toxin [Betaproteobacteria bacterium]